jgi:hypothetical protein
VKIGFSCATKKNDVLYCKTNFNLIQAIQKKVICNREMNSNYKHFIQGVQYGTSVRTVLSMADDEHRAIISLV